MRELREDESEDERWLRWSRWMSQSQDGDREAYAELMRELARVIDAFVRARFGTSPFVDDCVQESLLSIHRARASYDPRRPFRPWLFAVVRRRVIDCLRADSRRAREAPLDTAPAAFSVDPARPLDGERILARLTPQQSEALIMTKFYGHSIAEAARSAGVSETAMKARVHRAVSEARRALEREGRGRLLAGFSPREEQL
ncbi:MAG: sigma-70 family RNA polymerase sigma factor [Myxococcota bacterium]